MKTNFNKTFDASLTIENYLHKTVMTLSGRLISLEADSIWEHVNTWFKEYKNTAELHTEINLELEYINTRNVVELFKILKKIEKCNPQNTNISINWICETGDFDMVDLGYDMNVLCGLPFRIKYVEPIRKSA